MNELLKNLTCSGTECFCWIIVLLNIFAVFYLVYCSFRKPSELTKIYGWVYSGVILCTSIIILFFHTCIYTLMASVFTGMMLMAILSIILPQNGEAREKVEKTKTTKAIGAYVISETYDKKFVFALYDSKRRLLVNSTYAYDSLEIAKEKIKNCRDNGRIAETEDRSGVWIQEKFIPKYEIYKTGDKFEFSLRTYEEDSIIRSEKFIKVADCLALLDKVKANIDAIDLYMSVEKVNGAGYKKWEEPVEEKEEEPIEEVVEQAKKVEIEEPIEEVVNIEPVEQEIVEAPIMAEPIMAKNLMIETEVAQTVLKPSYVSYNRSFVAKLIQSSDDVKKRYSSIKNTLLAYGVKSRTSWSNETFRLGLKTVAKLGIKGKTLSIYLRLNGANLEDSKYIFEDASDVKRYIEVPLRFKLRSARSVKWGNELIAMMMNELGIEKKDVAYVDYAPQNKTTEELVKEGLIKMLVSGDGESAELENATYEAMRTEKFKQLN